MSRIQVFKSSDMKILAFDCLLTAFIIGFGLNSQKVMHPAFCFLIALIAVIALGLFFRTKIGFWIVTIIFSFVWAILSASLAFSITNNDPTWGWVIGGVTFIACIGLHKFAKRFNDNVSGV